jgi:hypothetical protein
LEGRNGGAENADAHLHLREDFRVSVFEEGCFAAEGFIEAEEAKD